MKFIYFVLFILMNTTLFSQSNSIPLSIVQKQLDAYNKQDIEAFCNVFDENVKVYKNITDTVAYVTNKEALYKTYNELFKKYPKNYSTLKSRMQNGNFIIDHEYITGRETPLEVIAIYEVKNDKIIRCWFIR